MCWRTVRDEAVVQVPEAQDKGVHRAARGIQALRCGEVHKQGMKFYQSCIPGFCATGASLQTE